MHIRKGLSTDLARLECCDFSFTVDEIAREPFLNDDLHIEALTEPYLKTYELDLQTLENHCVNPDSIFLIAETDDGEIAGFITASCNWNKFISVDYIAVERSKRRTGAAHKLMSATHVWARSLNAPGLRLETQNVNVSACLLSSLWVYSRRLRSLPLQRPAGKDEVALSGITCWLEKIFYIRYRKIDLSEFVNFARLRLIND